MARLLSLSWRQKGGTNGVCRLCLLISRERVTVRMVFIGVGRSVVFLCLSFCVVDIVLCTCYAEFHSRSKD